MTTNKANILGVVLMIIALVILFIFSSINEANSADCNGNDLVARAATIESNHTSYNNATSIKIWENGACVDFEVKGRNKIVCGNFDISYN